jgi:N-acetylglucosamine-6-phosphate deacetylase
VAELGATRVLTPEGLVGPAVVALDGDRITRIEPTGAPVPDRTLAPGFVDLQVNGMEDVDVATADDAGWKRLDAHLVATGVTSWCPTLVSAPPEAYPRRLERVAEAAARPADGRPHVAGAHLEGPFLGGCPGAHPPELLRPIDLGWLAALPAVVRLVTLAPELDGAVEAVRLLTGRGVAVALGHTSAAADQVAAAAAAGARMVTHLYNGMVPFHHRDPGAVGAALRDDRLTACLIADLVHVHPTALALAFRAKPAGRVALVTDAIAWRAPAHAGQVVHLVDGVPRLADGTLAGSALSMPEAVANVVHHAGVPLAEGLWAASTAPADALGLEDRGRIVPGARADVVALGPDLAVEGTWIGGRQVHG